MTVAPKPGTRGLALLVVHCTSLDPEAPSARERLEAALGTELAGRLVTALSRGVTVRARFAA